MKDGISKKEWAALMFAGARMAPEPSRALPQHAYGDPARHVLFEREQLEREKARAKRRAVRSKGE